MVARGRQPLFGTLSHNGTSATVEKTPVGWALVHQQRRLLELCPEIKILADKVMPDHHHIVIQVQRTMPRSIKEVLRGFMQGCKAEARQMGITENLYDAPPFYRVLTHKDQLHAMIEYVKANAERAWLRRQHPDLFRLHRHTTTCGLPFTDPRVQAAVEATLRRKAEAKHYAYSPIPTHSLRYRFTALNEIGRMLSNPSPQA